MLQLRPEFHALELSAQRRRPAAKTDAWKWSPSISAFGNARKFNYDNFNRDHYSWAVGAAARLGASSTAATAMRSATWRTRRWTRRRRGLEVLTDSVRDDLANRAACSTPSGRACTPPTRAVELAKETMELVRTQYEAGTVTQVDLLHAQDSLVNSQEALAQLRFDLAVADLAYRTTAGTFPPK